MVGRRSDELLLVVTREPIPGFTKTRLGDTIGMERAAELHGAFLADVATTFVPATRAGTYDFGWAFTPAGYGFRECIARICPDRMHDRVHFVPQEGDGLGARQTQLLRWGHAQGYDRTILIASDSPHLGLDVVADAFRWLRSHDVALGRVHDGGYYLIGVHGFHDVLTGVPTSTASAADALVQRAAGLGLRTAELPATFDIDVEADLDLLIAHLSPTNGAAAPSTWRALAELGLLPAGSRDAPGATSESTA